MEFIIGEHAKRCPRCKEENGLFDSIFIEPNGQKHTMKVCYACKANFMVGKVVADINVGDLKGN